MKNTADNDFALGDARLDARAHSILRKLGHNPQASFPAVFAQYAELEGFYRFVNNDRIGFDDILKPFFSQTFERIKSLEEVLVIHDTTAICPSVKGSSIKEFRPLDTANSHGFFAHLSLAVSSDGTRKIHGPLEAMLWTRGIKKDRKACRLKDNENHRWADQILHIKSQAGSNLIHVADREADAYAGFCKLIDGEARFVIRLTHDRSVHAVEGDRLFEVFRGRPPLTTRRVDLSARKAHHYEKQNKRHPPRSARQADLELSAKRVIIKKSRSVRGDYPPAITMNVVRVYEPKPPRGQKPIQWYLITTEPIDTREQVEKIVDIYKTRWVIEEYFKALKTGCNLETRLLESAQAWYRTVALFIPIACNIYNLKTLSEVSPKEDALAVLTPTQWRILGHLASARQRRVESIEDVKNEIALLGGHIKYSGPPGWITLSRGYLRLLEMEIGWDARNAICDQR